jgi:hypothetical protein
MPRVNMKLATPLRGAGARGVPSRGGARARRRALPLDPAQDLVAVREEEGRLERGEPAVVRECERDALANARLSALGVARAPGAPALLEARDLAFIHGEQQGVAAGEVLVERAHGDARSLRDVDRRERVGPALGQHQLGGFDDRLDEPARALLLGQAAADRVARSRHGLAR